MYNYFEEEYNKHSEYEQRLQEMYRARRKKAKEIDEMLEWYRKKVKGDSK